VGRERRDTGYVPVLLVSLVGLAVSLLFLGRESFWLDEAYSVSFAKLETDDFWRLVTRREANMVLYYILLRGWIGIGDEEFIVRLLSTIPAVASIPLCYAVASRLFGRRIGLPASALLAFNAFLLYYAQEARGYSLLLLLVLLSTYLFVRSVTEDRWPWWVGYVVVSGVALYSHFFAAFVLLAHLISTLFLNRASRPHVLRLAMVYAAIALVASPLGLFALSTGGVQVFWVPPLAPLAVTEAVAKLAGGRTAIVGALLVVGLALASWLTIRRLYEGWRRSGRSDRAWRLTLTLGWLVIPLGAALVISPVKPIFIDRYLIVAVPGLALTAAFGLATLKPALTRIGLAILLILQGSQVAILLVEKDKDDWRSTVPAVLARAAPGDGIAFYAPGARVPFGYYLDQVAESSSSDVPDPVLPAFDWRTRFRPTPSVPSFDAIRRASRPFPRLWVVLSPLKPGTESSARKALERSFRPAARMAFQDIVVILYVRTS
jgi:mannosyltransferase